MSHPRWAASAHALRALAAPVPVLSLMVLVLNDHVLKQAWPGLVTGKLSDVAGLVVAPLLLAVLLAAIGVRRALPVAIGLTGLGFVFAKTSVAGAAATSAAWSLSGIPTLIRADVTDLLALPALGVAWWVDRRVRSSADLPWRRVTSLALGMAVLPVAVLGTAATSCDEGTRITGVSRVEGDFPGRPRVLEQRLVLKANSTLAFTIDPDRAVESELVEIVPSDASVPEQCSSSDPTQCWRLVANDAVVDNRRVDAVAVEHSADGGTTWQMELELSEDQLEAIRDDTDGCGGPDWITAFDLAVMPTEGEPVVVVPIGKGGVFMRDEDALWRLYTPDELRDRAVPSVTESPLTLTPLDQSKEESTPGQPGPGQPGPDGSTPTCPSPTPTTVTPHPSNGPPTTYLTCP